MICELGRVFSAPLGGGREAQQRADTGLSDG